MEDEREREGNKEERKWRRGEKDPYGGGKEIILRKRENEVRE